MTPDQYQRAKSIFLDVCDLPGPDSARAARISELAAGDEAVRDQAMRLLASDQHGKPDSAGETIRRGLQELLVTSPQAHTNERHGQNLPETIGQYRILRAIGAGGMGDVYEAQQETPRRSVAIKLMRSGIASDALVRRFRREVEFIGRLSHPGIAQVYEAGIATIGNARVPFFAMEFVSGQPLTTFARESQLTVSEKLALFATVCDTVQYAHQQGVIHRDLKPANILVESGHHQTRPSGTSAPPPDTRTTGDSTTSSCPRGFRTKVLDFGIARAVEPDTASATIATEAGQIIGTIPYMSPEQIGGRSADIDTRTDVYALGVILFELLTARLPHATEGLSLLDAARLKSQSAPNRLSTFDPNLRGDLDSIAAKALESEKQRRYASASELAQDVRRYLSNEPVTARPATAFYHLRKFARRNRAVVAAAALAFLILVAGVITTALQARAAFRERDIAVRKTQVAEDVSELLLRTFTVATPKGTPGREPRLIDAVDRIEADAKDDTRAMNPEVKAVVLNIIGILHRERGSFDKAEENFTTALEIRRRVLAPGDPNLADSLNNMGLLRKRQERYAEAATFYQEAVDLQRHSTLPDDSRLARNIYNLASAYIAAGNIAQAKPLLDESLVMHLKLVGEKNELIAYHLSSKAKIAMAESRWQDAESLATQALEMYRATVGTIHPSFATALCDQGVILAHSNPAAGIPALAQADAIAHQVFTVDPLHPTLKSIRQKLITVLREAGRESDAARLEADPAATLQPHVPDTATPTR